MSKESLIRILREWATAEDFPKAYSIRLVQVLLGDAANALESMKDKERAAFDAGVRTGRVTGMQSGQGMLTSDVLNQMDEAGELFAGAAKTIRAIHAEREQLRSDVAQLTYALTQSETRYTELQAQLAESHDGLCTWCGGSGTDLSLRDTP